MHTTPGIILQARIDSRRLPRKALATIGGRTLLEQCLRRLRASAVPHVILATTDRAADDPLEAIARRLDVPVFRGGADDVLGRVVACAAAFAIDPIVRATGDNPGVDILAPGRLLAALARTGADYVRERGLPYGADVEAVRADALARAAVIADAAFDREHVTTVIRRRDDLFRSVELDAPAALTRPDLRVTVDTFDDLQRIRALYLRAGSDLPTLDDLIAAADHSVDAEAAR